MERGGEGEKTLLLLIENDGVCVIISSCNVVSSGTMSRLMRRCNPTPPPSNFITCVFKRENGPAIHEPSSPPFCSFIRQYLPVEFSVSPFILPLHTNQNHREAKKSVFAPAATLLALQTTKKVTLVFFYGTFWLFSPFFAAFRHFPPLFAVFRRFSPFFAVFRRFSPLFAAFCRLSPLFSNAYSTQYNYTHDKHDGLKDFCLSVEFYERIKRLVSACKPFLYEAIEADIIWQ